MRHAKIFFAPLIFTAALILLSPVRPAQAAYHFANFKGRPPIHQFGGASAAPAGLSPAQIKRAYNLPANGGQGIIAIVGAYDDKNIEKDLAVFDKQFNLPPCTTANGCFTKHVIGKAKSDSGWAMETSLDVEWAHAIAPQAKILLVEATTPSGQNLLNAIDYAVKQSGVVSVSMSWGGAEFPEEVSLDSHFQTVNGTIAFFASSGDNGAGASWPAASPNVIGVGGTHVNFSASGVCSSETAWTGSGGGVSAYEIEPAFQKNYSIAKAQGHRAIPDVSYNADPSSGFAIYKSAGSSKKGWYVVGGTSAGAPQWAAIKALGLSADNFKFYSDKNSAANGNFFRDIKSGANGDCGFYCQARGRYDYVTGLGSPLTVNF
ncbi:MAG TPA: S53 family peptidase [Candidatus Methylomirabilis sp.]|nr:S53 family peptidase [Candidatus Methylomirabilis sp.]